MSLGFECKKFSYRVQVDKYAKLHLKRSSPCISMHTHECTHIHTHAEETHSWNSCSSGLSTESLIHKSTKCKPSDALILLIHMHINSYFPDNWHKSIQICRNTQPFLLGRGWLLRYWNHLVLGHLQSVTNNRWKKCYQMSKFSLQDKIVYTGIQP